eukprot:1621571-Amphidinium_carterae.1
MAVHPHFAVQDPGLVQSAKEKIRKQRLFPEVVVGAWHTDSLRSPVNRVLEADLPLTVAEKAALERHDRAQGGSRTGYLVLKVAAWCQRRLVCMLDISAWTWPT